MSGRAGQGNTDSEAASGSPWRRIEAGVAALVLVLALAGCGGAGPRGGTPAAVQPPPVCPADAAPSFPPETLPGRASLQGALAPAMSSRLQDAFDLAVSRLPATSMSAAVALPGQGGWSAAQGSAEPLYAWASAGKQAIAAVVLQLADEGRLSLSDTLAQRLPDAAKLPNAERITIAQLLAHTSGLYSANEARAAQGKRGPYTQQEELDILARHGALFPPGACWRYSNSGYRLLGSIVARVTGRPWQDEIQARVIDRLGLRHMRVVTDAASLVGVAPPSTADGSPALDLDEPGAAGALLASAADMVRFEQALLNGELLSPASLQAMLGETRRGFQPGMYYGLGTMVYDIPDRGGRLRWLGHSGGGPGISAVVAYDIDRRAFVAAVVNGGGDAHAVANLLLRALDAR